MKKLTIAELLELREQSKMRASEIRPRVEHEEFNEKLLNYYEKTVPEAINIEIDNKFKELIPIK